MSLFWLRRPHVPLLVLLVLAVAIYPVIEASSIGRWGLNVLVIVGIVLSLQRVHVPRHALRAAIVLALVAVVTAAMHAFDVTSRTDLLAAVAQTAFYTAAALLMCSYMLRDARATVDELFAAATAFLLLAMAWTGVFWCIEFLHPGSFAVNLPAVAGQISLWELFYFSMTTLSTTGYGDIVPAASGARGAVILEQFLGVLYVALVISRLAGFAGRRPAAP